MVTPALSDSTNAKPTLSSTPRPKVEPSKVRVTILDKAKEQAATATALARPLGLKRVQEVRKPLTEEDLKVIAAAIKAIEIGKPPVAPPPNVSISPSLNPFSLIKEACKAVVLTHMQGFNGTRLYLKGDFSKTTIEGEKATVTQLLLRFQDTIHKCKWKEQDLKQSNELIIESIKLLHMISEFGQQQKLFKFRSVFEQPIYETVRHSYVASGISSDICKKVFDLPTLNFFKDYSTILSLLTASKEFTHMCSRFARITRLCKDCWEKNSVFTRVVFGEQPLLNDGKADSKTSIPEILRVSTVEGMSLLIRCFNKVDSERTILTPKISFTEEQVAKIEKVKMQQSLEVQSIIDRFLFCSSELNKISDYALILKRLKSGSQEINQFIGISKNLNILIPFFEFFKFASTEISLLKGEPNEIAMKVTEGFQNRIKSNLLPLESTLNAYYNYLHNDIIFELNLKPKGLKPKRMFNSLLGLNVQDDLFKPELFKSITIVSNPNTDLEICDKEAQARIIARTINATTVPFPSRLGREKVEQEDGKGNTSRETQQKQQAAVSQPVVAVHTPAVAVQSVDESLPFQVICKDSVFQDGIKYHPRVKQWFENPEIALKDPKYAVLTPIYREKVRLLHAFPLLIDKFIGNNGTYSRKTTKRDERSGLDLIQYLLPTQVSIGESSFFAVIEYTFLPSGICYHRCISEKQLGNFLVSWDKFNFPPLEDSVKMGVEKSSKIDFKGMTTNLTFKPGLEIFKIVGEGIVLELMKTGD